VIDRERLALLSSSYEFHTQLLFRGGQQRSPRRIIHRELARVTLVKF
jgi:hypothetical protein